MAQLGVAFVRGLNMFGRNRITVEEMRNLLIDIEDDSLHIIDLYKPDNIIFQKTGIHYAQVGLRIQAVLQDLFGKEVMVTTRSINTINGLMKRIYEKDYQNL
ncbi:MAG: DUF1697 domain-containing protein [ANME-2 cluster archaeon]|nr:DUF1697 domain-containing protein [ANME-2 cluster archaeon]